MANPGRRRRGERDVNGSEAGGELGRKSVDDLATSLTGKTGDPPRRQSHGVEELREGRELADGHALPCAEQGNGMTRMEVWMTNGPWLTVF